MSEDIFKKWQREGSFVKKKIATKKQLEAEIKLIRSGKVGSFVEYDAKGATLKTLIDEWIAMQERLMSK